MSTAPQLRVRTGGERETGGAPDPSAPLPALPKPIISLSNVTRSFAVGGERTEVLKGVSLDVYPGELIVISGANGSGKSTLLRILGLLDSDFEGSFVLDRQEVAGRPEWWLDEIRACNVGFVFQEGRLFDHRTLDDNIRIPQRLGAGQFSKAQAAKELERWTPMLFTEAELGNGLLRRRPDRASGGQRQRAAIARSIVAGPGIILADEPTASLDPLRKGDIVGRLCDLAEAGRTVIVVSHDDVFGRVGRQLVMRNGRLEPKDGSHAPPADIETAPASVLPLHTDVRGAQSWFGWRPRAKLTTLAREVYREVFLRPLFLFMILTAVLASVCQLSVFTSLMLGAEQFLEYAVRTGSRFNRLEIKPRRENLGKDDLFPDRREIVAWPQVEQVVPRREAILRLVPREGERLNLQVLGLHVGDPEFKLLPFEAGGGFKQDSYQLEIIVAASVLGQLFDDTKLRDGSERYSDFIGRTVVIRVPRFAPEGIVLDTTDVKVRVAGIVTHGEGRIYAYLPNSTLRIIDQAIRERRPPPVTPEGEAWSVAEDELNALANYPWEQRLQIYARDLREVVSLYSQLSTKGYQPVTDIFKVIWVFDIKDILTRVLLPLLIVVGVVMLISLYSNVAVGARLREKELALWRILGMRKGDLILTQLCATLIIIAGAAVSGLLLAHVLVDFGAQIMHAATKTAALSKPMDESLLPIHLIFSPIRDFAPWVLAATLVAGLTAAFRPALKAAQTNPVKILQG